nr:hypothetical protein [Tanacetum cinerariifolium]
HIPPLLAISPFLSSTDDTTDSDTPDTPPSPTLGTPFTKITSFTHISSVIPHHRVMILTPKQPIPHGRPYHYHPNGSPMIYVPALSPVFGALSSVRANLIPSLKRVRDSGYLADIEVDLTETSLRDDVIVRGSDEPHLEQDIDLEIQAEIDECIAYADALRDRGIDARPIPHGRPYHYHPNGSAHMMTVRNRVGPLHVQQLAVGYLVDHSSLDYFSPDDLTRYSSSDSSSEASSDFHSDASSNSSSRHSLSYHFSLDLPSTSSGPSRKRRRSPMIYVPALSPVFRALSSVCADLIPSLKRVRDSGYLADIEVDLTKTSLRDDVIVRGIDRLEAYAKKHMGYHP